MHPSWRPVSGAHVRDFAFASPAWPSVLCVKRAVLIDREGKVGIWDVFEAIFGVRNVPKITSNVWHLVLNNVVFMRVWPSGYVKFNTTTADVEDIEKMEAASLKNFQAEWMQGNLRHNEEEPVRIAGGMEGARARERGHTQVFH